MNNVSKQLQNLSQLVRNWIDQAEGRFSTHQIDSDIGIDSAEGKHIRRGVIKEYIDKGEIKRIPEIVGVYRKVNEELKVLDWRAANSTRIFKELKWPFGLEQFVEIYPGNIIVIAGSKDAGKTAFVLNFIALNQFTYNIVYFTSELGDIELKRRLMKFELEGIMPLDSWNFTAIDRTRDFSDVIEPDKINIIDFLEIHDKFYEVGGLVLEMYEALRNGIAIVVLQKNPGVELPLGGARGVEKARLYVSIDPHEATIRSGKNWAREGVNPRGKKFTFDLINGARFVVK